MYPWNGLQEVCGAGFDGLRFYNGVHLGVLEWNLGRWSSNVIAEVIPLRNANFHWRLFSLRLHLPHQLTTASHPMTYVYDWLPRGLFYAFLNTHAGVMVVMVFKATLCEGLMHAFVFSDSCQGLLEPFLQGAVLSRTCSISFLSFRFIQTPNLQRCH